MPTLLYDIHEFNNLMVNNYISSKSTYYMTSSCGPCCTRSARHRHGTLFPLLVFAPYFRLRADGRCRAVQARLCRKRCRYVIGLGLYLLSMTSSPFALAAVPGFSSFHFRFAPSDKRAFCHSSLVTLYPAPLLPLDDNSSIAWSVRAPVQYI